MAKDLKSEILTSITKNFPKGDINIVEACSVLENLKNKSNITDSEIIDLVLPQLGFSKSLRTLKMIFGLKELNSFFREYVVARNMPLKFAYWITQLNDESKRKLEDYAKRPGVSLSRVLQALESIHIRSERNKAIRQMEPDVQTGYEFDRIFIDSISLKDEVTQRILSRLNLPHDKATGREVKDYVHKNYEDPLAGGKRVLFLTRNKGRKLKKCPGTKNKICCGYHVMNLYTNCPIDCSYCILQNYLNNPYITVYTNIDEYIEDIECVLSNNAGFLRIGTGELTDSLALDYLTDYSSVLIDFFSIQKNASLELKTKSICIENILKKDPPGNVVISWSLNPEGLIKTDELYAASLDERLNAARKCQERGYPVSFHFDPIILHDNFMEGYGNVINQMRKKLLKENVCFISLGALRFDPSLKPIMLERFPESKIFYKEFTKDSDNKLRYTKSERVEAFKEISGLLKKGFPKSHIYLCMEDEVVWESIAKK